MNSSGGDNSTDLMVRARSVLLDALAALTDQRQAVIVIGAQAIYLHTGSAGFALAEATKDSDLALDPRQLHDLPRVEQAMVDAGFLPSPNDQPGSWVNSAGIPVDLMVPEALAGGGGRQARGARIPPHSKRAARRARGLEAVLVEHAPVVITSLAVDDQRHYTVSVAGPAALLVAKLHKLGERIGTPDRLNDKDAHDIYRILRVIPIGGLAASFKRLLADPLSADVTDEALSYLREMFVTAQSLGASMAGRAETGIGEPLQVSEASAILAQELLVALEIPSSN